MRIFVAGGTGVLGRRAVKLMAEAGHDVTVATRSPTREAIVRALGATPVPVDLFDAVALTRAVDGHDTVANLATHIPKASQMAMPSAWKDNDRLRTEASTNLGAALLSTGGQRFIQESIAFVYADAGDSWISEDDPVEGTANLASALVAESNAARVAESGATGIVLRFAQFYGPDSHTTHDMIRFARKRVAGGFGKDTYVSSVTTDDAASAVIAALGAPSGLYNVGDDEPLTRLEYTGVLARAVGARPPIIPPPTYGSVGRRPGCGHGPLPAGLEQALARGHGMGAPNAECASGMARGRRLGRGGVERRLIVPLRAIGDKSGLDQLEERRQTGGVGGVARSQESALRFRNCLARLERLSLRQDDCRGKTLD